MGPRAAPHAPRARRRRPTERALDARVDPERVEKREDDPEAEAQRVGLVLRVAADPAPGQVRLGAEGPQRERRGGRGDGRAGAERRVAPEPPLDAARRLAEDHEAEHGALEPDAVGDDGAEGRELEEGGLRLAAAVRGFRRGAADDDGGGLELVEAQHERLEELDDGAALIEGGVRGRDRRAGAKVLQRHDDGPPGADALARPEAGERPARRYQGQRPAAARQERAGDHVSFSSFRLHRMVEGLQHSFSRPSTFALSREAHAHSQRLLATFSTRAGAPASVPTLVRSPEDRASPSRNTPRPRSTTAAL